MNFVFPKFAQSGKLILMLVRGVAIYLIIHFSRSASEPLFTCPAAYAADRPSILSFFLSVLFSHNNNKKAMATIARVSGNAIINPVVQLMTDIISKEDEGQILQIDLSRMEILLENICLFRGQQKAPPEILKIWLQLLQNCLGESKRLLDRSGPRQSCLDCLVRNPRRLSKEVRVWNAFFDHLYHGFQSELPLLVTSLQFVSSKPLYKEEALLEGVAAPHGFVGSRIMDAEHLSEEEGWMLFRRVAFKNDQVSMDIQERARRFADQCKGVPLVINIVAAMIGQTCVDTWDTCFSLMKNVDPSFLATHPSLDAELCALLQCSYDALPNSNVKNCFLYCALYKEDQEIDSRQLVQMWIGEGLVKSKQGTHLMDMAIGRSYIKLLVDRCFFQIVKESKSVFRTFNESTYVHDVIPSIRVHHLIRDMAMYIAQKEENSLFMASQNLQNLPEAHHENLMRISVADNYIGDLLADWRCPRLLSLISEGNTNLKGLPSEFLLSLTSLRVLNLSGCTEITSVPTSMGRLRMLEFLSFSGLLIKDLPQEICHLSKLQFLDLSRCTALKSLPSQIGELQNLKHLNLDKCDSLMMIPREISELTSLSRLQLYTDLSLEMERPASIWSLMGLKSLMELEVWIDMSQDLESSTIKDGILGTWLEMRHLALYFRGSQIMGDLPGDMQNMKKLQSFMLFCYPGINLPNCKFELLEMVKLIYCSKIMDLSPLELLPNLKLLKLDSCENLTELGIGNPRRYLKLEKLVLQHLDNLESLGGLSNKTVWDERTVPHLRVLKIDECPSLKRFPIGIEKLQNLCALIYLQYPGGQSAMEWWESMVKDENMKVKLQKYLYHVVNKCQYTCCNVIYCFSSEVNCIDFLLVYVVDLLGEMDVIYPGLIVEMDGCYIPRCW